MTTAAAQATDEQSEWVAVIGASMTQFGQREKWILDLLAEAGIECLDDAGVDAAEVDHLYVSNMTSGEFEGMTGVMNALVHDLDAMPAYTQRVDQTSSSGGAEIYAAWQSIKSGANEMTPYILHEELNYIQNN